MGGLKLRYFFEDLLQRVNILTEAELDALIIYAKKQKEIKETNRKIEVKYENIK